MLARVALTVTVILLVLAAASVAGPKKWEIKHDKVQIAQDQSQIKATKLMLKRLTHAIDLWHDANLKGDEKAVLQYEEALSDLVQTDLNETETIINRCEREVEQSTREFHRGQRRWTEKVDDRRDYADDKSDLNKTRQLLGAKKRLASSWAGSDAFSNKYRLINDYADLLRQQTNLGRLELAEDVRELHEDR